MTTLNRFNQLVLLFIFFLEMWIGPSRVHAQESRLLVTGSLYVPTQVLSSLDQMSNGLKTFNSGLAYTVNRYSPRSGNVVLVVSYC